jgi:hypothetical protein
MFSVLSCLPDGSVSSIIKLGRLQVRRAINGEREKARDAAAATQALAAAAGATASSVAFAAKEAGLPDEQVP